MVVRLFPNGEMDANAVMEMIFDKTFIFYRKGRKVICKNAKYSNTKSAKKAQGSISFTKK